ncbi:hypothetical protein AX16_006306 [Volvariella volvacea WC 439]|nr:hypothetical protein AX16_006306 [Volvariella volvacea WC 439]
MKIAVQGCCHGVLDAIYTHIRHLEQRNRYTVDLLLMCGDFEALRNPRDLHCMAVPEKYKELGQFYKYYTREKTAPVLTIVIGGNHEASNYMQELYHGGWLAPNIYFLGHAGCVRVNGLRISGASGIFKSHDYRVGQYETVPYDKGTMRSVYHIREFNVNRLSLLSNPNVFLSHDWPLGITKHGDVKALLKARGHLRGSIMSNALGSQPLMDLLQTLKPNWWFSAHMHTRFEAIVPHGSAQQGDSSTNDEIATTSFTPSSSAAATKFLALDKCLHDREFLEVIDIPAPNEGQNPNGLRPTLTFDPEWLAIMRAFNPWFSTRRHQIPFPTEQDARELVRTELEWVREHVGRKFNGKPEEEWFVLECQQFAQTAPGGAHIDGGVSSNLPPWYANPQTDAICQLLEIENKINRPHLDAMEARNRR